MKQRWLADSDAPGGRALRQALDEAAAVDETHFAKQRVWNRVQVPWVGLPEGPRTQSGRGWRSVLALTGVAVAAAGLVLVGSRLLEAPAPVVVGPAPETAPLADVTPLPPPATIALTTGPGEHARHRIARGVSVELAARSAVIPGDETMPPEVKVGRARFSVPHQAPGRKYVVRAGAYRVVVLGTTFDVTVAEAGVGVAVASGVVAIEDAASGRRLARLEPGMRWSSAGGELKRPARRARAGVPAAAVRDSATARALDEAGELRERGDPQSAIARYRRLADVGGPMAEVALYEIGVIEAVDLRQPKQALATWQRLRERYPAGLLRAETDLSIVETLARTGEHRQALDEAAAFLHRHPRSERRAEVARVAGDLARTGGNCALALGFYETAAQGRPDQPDVDDASFHYAACLSVLGDRRATEAARAYLTRFPFGPHAVAAQRLLAGGKVDAGAPPRVRP